MKRCHRCGNPWGEKDPPGFNNTCDACGIALHSCANCEHHRHEGAQRCVLPGTERILDAFASNRCPKFAFRMRAGVEQAAQEASAKVRQALTADQPEVGRQKSWEELFGT